MIVRDFEKGTPLFKVHNFEQVIGFTLNTRAQFSSGFEIGDIVMTPEDPYLLITSESKRIRVWDLRKSLGNGGSV